MKILQLTQRFPPAPGGVEEHVFQISKRLAQKGHEIVVFTSDLEKDKPFIRLPPDKCLPMDNERVNVCRFKALKLLNLKYGVGVIIPSMLKATLKEKADVVHAHAFGFWPTYVGMAKKIFDQTPLIVTPHSNPGSKDYGPLDIRKLPLKKANRLIALTKLERRHLISTGMGLDRISVVPNGIDLEKFRRIPNASDENNIVLYVGKIDIEHKGVDTLMKAVPLVLESIPHARFIFVGPDWGDMVFLKKLSCELNVRDHVIFTGFVSEKEKVRYYTIADICVIPSNIEPFGIVILESMACGKPVIGTRVGGIPDVIKDYENGILVPRKNPEKLADAISFLLLDKATATKMGEKGRKEAQQYSWSSIVDQIEKIYCEADG